MNLLSEQRELHDAVASFGLMLGNVDALRHEVVCRCRQGAAMGKLFYAVEAVFGHLVRGYEYGLCLPLTPLIESFIVETSFVFFYISVCSFVWNVAIYHAVFGYRDFFVIKHRGCDGRICPHEYLGRLCCRSRYCKRCNDVASLVRFHLAWSLVQFFF